MYLQVMYPLQMMKKHAKEKIDQEKQKQTEEFRQWKIKEQETLNQQKETLANELKQLKERESLMNQEKQTYKQTVETLLSIAIRINENNDLLDDKTNSSTDLFTIISELNHIIDSPKDNEIKIQLDKDWSDPNIPLVVKKGGSEKDSRRTHKLSAFMASASDKDWI